MNRRRPVSHRRVSTHRSRYGTSNPPARRIAPLREGSQTKDLSGSLQGAGGVGGLLAVRTGDSSCYPAYDNNGNIVAYAGGSGAVVASYAYDAFGNTSAASGPLASTFAHRFSTKPLDPATGLYYYGYRFYAPSLGRWMNRDPIEERGGVNLYVAMLNNPTDIVDVFGLKCRIHVVFGHIFDIDTDEYRNVAFAYRTSTVRAKRKEFFDAIKPAYAMNKTLEVFQHSDDCDRISAITCYADTLRYYLEYIGAANYSGEHLEAWNAKLNATLDANLTRQQTVIEFGLRDSPENNAYKDAVMNVYQFILRSIGTLCSGSDEKCCSCKKVALTFHIDPERKGMFSGTVAPSSENLMHGSMYFQSIVKGLEHYDTSRMGEELTMITSCKDRSYTLLGFVDEDRIRAEMKDAE